MSSMQDGILAPIPALSRYLTLALQPGADLPRALRALAEMADGERLVVGLGGSLVAALGRKIPGLRSLAPISTAGVDVPATPAALWCWLRGDDRGDLLHHTRKLLAALDGALQLEQLVDGFRHGSGLDLSGYEDGTENPTGAAAIEAAFACGQGAGLDGASFVAVQQWLHDLDRFDALDGNVQDAAIGRRRSDNVELDDAPASAHVKRTAQESFEPEAFMLRRSMPWAEGLRSGLMFVAFGKSFDAFEVQLQRMAGIDDGIVDALFGFTRPITGSYYWCPPMRDGQLDLRALGL
jgi:putative iron-dependent peroxidase